jgi:hypothetical protein
MNIFKLVLLSSLRLAFFGVLKVALFIYIIFVPDSPLVGVAPDGDGRPPMPRRKQVSRQDRPGGTYSPPDIRRLLDFSRRSGTDSAQTSFQLAL